MNLARWYAQSDYMEFSKLRSAATYNLATSGVKNCSISDLSLRLEELEITGPAPYGHPPLLEAIAGMKGGAPERVVLAAGTSMANHLAMAALFAPGDEVLIEEPTYGLLLDAAQYLGAKVRRFQRRFEDDYALDPEEVAANLTPETRLVVLTNMHNPSSALAGEDSLREIGELADVVGARVLVDEVYLECLHHPPMASAAHLGDHFVTTSSLTKAYGLSGLRCGWILAEPKLAERMWRLNDLFASTPVHIAELLSVMAIEQIESLAERADALIEANRSAMIDAIEGHPAIELSIPSFGTTIFPRLRQGDVAEFCDFLRDRYDTSVVPGSYFERPQHIRVGLAGDVAMTREGLGRLARALTEWQQRTSEGTQNGHFPAD
jgi:aspartate/methionine/tyrosine aminotransferase